MLSVTIKVPGFFVSEFLVLAPLFGSRNLNDCNMGQI